MPRAGLVRRGPVVGRLPVRARPGGARRKFLPTGGIRPAPLEQGYRPDGERRPEHDRGSTDGGGGGRGGRRPRTGGAAVHPRGAGRPVPLLPQPARARSGPRHGLRALAALVLRRLPRGAARPALLGRVPDDVRLRGEHGRDRSRHPGPGADGAADAVPRRTRPHPPAEPRPARLQPADGRELPGAGRRGHRGPARPRRRARRARADVRLRLAAARDRDRRDTRRSRVRARPLPWLGERPGAGLRPRHDARAVGPGRGGPGRLHRLLPRPDPGARPRAARRPADGAGRSRGAGRPALPRRAGRTWSCC